MYQSKDSHKSWRSVNKQVIKTPRKKAWFGWRIETQQVKDAWVALKLSDTPKTSMSSFAPIRWIDGDILWGKTESDAEVCIVDGFNYHSRYELTRSVWSSSLLSSSMDVPKLPKQKHVWVSSIWWVSFYFKTFAVHVVLHYVVWARSGDGAMAADAEWVYEKQKRKRKKRRKKKRAR